MTFPTADHWFFYFAHGARAEGLDRDSASQTQEAGLYSRLDDHVWATVGSPNARYWTEAAQSDRPASRPATASQQSALPSLATTVIVLEIERAVRFPSGRRHYL